MCDPGVTLTTYSGERILCARTDQHTDRLLFYKEPPPEGVGDLARLVGQVSMHKMVLMAPQARWGGRKREGWGGGEQVRCLRMGARVVEVGGAAGQVRWGRVCVMCVGGGEGRGRMGEKGAKLGETENAAGTKLWCVHHDSLVITVCIMTH